ncbi:hypothetical protein M5J20_08280 [Corynebacterium sp. TA-R-1]|uniref:Suppressor of fused-like domain-containing protein n=1 Tax=Corynebacterium stercoris TaxID=2943490 RepID=A0ABT1G2D9_9CORY|nr:hypothetical protein [Corynebacterium stercoris]
MTGDDIVSWLDTLFPGLTLTMFAGNPVATSTHHGVPVGVTVGFSEVDTGLRLAGAEEVSVGCEIVLRANVDNVTLATTLVKAVRQLGALGVPPQPGVLLEGIGAGKVRHGWLREPRLFVEGTPHVRQGDHLTLLVELVMLTDDEFSIASEQGTDVLERRLRRRGVDVANWLRD